MKNLLNVIFYGIRNTITRLHMHLNDWKFKEKVFPIDSHRMYELHYTKEDVKLSILIRPDSHPVFDIIHQDRTVINIAKDNMQPEKIDEVLALYQKHLELIEQGYEFIKVGKYSINSEIYLLDWKKLELIKAKN